MNNFEYCQISNLLSSLELGFPGCQVVKNLPANAGDVGLFPELGISPGEGNGNPLQYSCLRNLINKGASQATAQGVTMSQTGLSN